MTSVGGATAIMAESLTKNVKKCSQRKTEINEVIDDNDSSMTPTYLGSNCPLMVGYRLGSNTSEGNNIRKIYKFPFHVDQVCCVACFVKVTSFFKDPDAKSKARLTFL